MTKENWRFGCGALAALPWMLLFFLTAQDRAHNWGQWMDYTGIPLLISLVGIGLAYFFRRNDWLASLLALALVFGVVAYSFGLSGGV